jgi:hypothetical protein
VVEIGELALDRAEPAYSWAASRMSV